MTRARGGRARGVGGAVGPVGRIGMGAGIAAGVALTAGAVVLARREPSDDRGSATPMQSQVPKRERSSSPVDAPEPRAGFVSANGDDLELDGRPFRAYGFNYTFGDMLGTTEYFQDPSPAGLKQVREDFRTAARMGANTLRVTLELFDFVERTPSGEVRVRPDRVEAYQRVLEEAERAGIKLDVTGNLVWKPNSAPAWYDQLPDRERWEVQATFWRGVAAAGADSPAILCYELTSEPVVKTEPSAPWYNEPYGGLHFIQTIARQATYEDADDTMRDWARTLRDAIRSGDSDHLIGVGLLNFTTGSASPEVLADEVDLLLLHDYPAGSADDPDDVDPYVATAREFASHGRPVILGETFALDADIPTQERYLREVAPLLDGTLTFFDGRTPADVRTTGMGDAFYRDNLRSYLSLRDELA